MGMALSVFVARRRNRSFSRAVGILRGRPLSHILNRDGESKRGLIEYTRITGVEWDCYGHPGRP